MSRVAREYAIRGGELQTVEREPEPMDRATESPRVRLFAERDIEQVEGTLRQIAAEVQDVWDDHRTDPIQALERIDTLITRLNSGLWPKDERR